MFCFVMSGNIRKIKEMKGLKHHGTRRDPDKPKREVRPLNPDEAVLNLLHDSSADLSKNRPVNFYLYFRGEREAKSAADELTAAGFSVQCQRSAGDKDWLCLASINVIPKIGPLTSIRRMLERLASKLGGNYDGWETELDANEGKGLPGV